VQDKPEGIAQAFILGENFIGDDSVMLVLGDNLFEDDFSSSVTSFTSGARIFAKEIHDPERYGVIQFDSNMKALSIEEKPKNPKSNFAATGLYIYDNTVVEKTKRLKPSARGELEITDLNNMYLSEGSLDVQIVTGRWLDTGTFESLFEATVVAREIALKEHKPRNIAGNNRSRESRSAFPTDPTIVTNTTESRSAFPTDPVPTEDASNPIARSS
jgi:glucose-1-phosphate thymidylyltransferase